MIERIKEALLNAGLPETPPSTTASLDDFGLDSLIMVMSVIEFEKSFGIKIRAESFSNSHFKNLETLELFLKQQGAK